MDVQNENERKKTKKEENWIAGYLDEINQKGLIFEIGSPWCKFEGLFTEITEKNIHNSVQRALNSVPTLRGDHRPVNYWAQD